MRDSIYEGKRRGKRTKVRKGNGSGPKGSKKNLKQMSTRLQPLHYMVWTTKMGSGVVVTATLQMGNGMAELD